MPISYAPGDMRYISDNYLTLMRDAQLAQQEQAYLQQEQMRLQNQALRQKNQFDFAAYQQNGPSYAGNSRGGGVDQSMLPEITAPRYLSANAEEPGSNVNWNNITPDSLRGSNTIAMSIARPGESPDAADAYYRTLTPNPQWETQRQARADAQYNLQGGGRGYDIARIQADTRLQGYENARALAEMADRRRREESAANIGAKVGGDIVNRTTIPQARGVLEDSLNWADRQLQSGGGVGGGASAPSADVQVGVGPKVGDRMEDGAVVEGVEADGSLIVNKGGKKFRRRMN